MAFDEAEYREEFLKKHRSARGVPGDRMSRYAITLPATDAEIAAQVKSVRMYWNKLCTSMTAYGQVARLCRAEDERLRAKHGRRMETRAWWQEQQTAAEKAAAGSIDLMADDLQRRFAKLGVVSGEMLGQFAAKLSLSPAQAEQAARRANVTVIRGVTLPTAEPIASFSALTRAMAECAVPSVPGLLHPGSGQFRLLERYECLADPHKRLDAVAVEAQRAAADKRGITATDDARRKALGLLDQAVRSGADLRDVALYQLVTIAQKSVSVSIDFAARELTEAGLTAADAAIVAVLVAEQAGSGPASVSTVSDLLTAGRLPEARAAAMALPADGGDHADAIKRIEDAQRQLDQLIAGARAALAVPDEARAWSLLKDAARISAEDAAPLLAAVPLPPPADARATADDGAVRLFWRPAPGHDAGTVYAVRRTLQPRPLTAPSEGEPVHRDRGDTCVDSRAPVARRVQYAVFALGDERPSSRPAIVTITPLPPVTGLDTEVSASAVKLSWSAHPDAEVQVTRVGPDGTRTPVRVAGSGCQVSGLAEGQPQRFEVTAVYRGPDGTELRSVPELASVTPRPRARPVTTLRATPVGEAGAVKVRITWVPVDASEVKVMRADRAPAIPVGTTVSAAEMSSVGPQVRGAPADASGRTGFDAALPPGVHRLVPFSVGGSGIVIGKTATVAVTDPVRQLSVTAFAEYATLSWEWPDNAQIAEVHWQLDGAEDVQRVDQGQLRSGGGFRVPLGHGPCHVEVRAVITVAGKRFTSPPVAVDIAQLADTPVRYQVANIGPSARPFGGKKSGKKKRVTFTADQGCADVRVVMVARQGPVMPVNASDGVPILDTRLSLGPGASREFNAAVPSTYRKPFWVRCFVAAGPARLIDPPVSTLKEM